MDSAHVAGRYRLVRELGRGGMGVVWEAFDELLRRPVAVKEVRFPPELSEQDRTRLAGRTLVEARAVAALDTPAAVRVYDIVEQDGRPWIVMELLRGTTLGHVVAREGGLAEHEVARIGLALLDALDAAHAAGVLHRDVKPGNVLLGEDGRVALTDFGIATVEGDSGDTTTGVVLGSPAYIAPERAAGARPTPAADLWALGATLWTAVEGRPPYAGATALATLAAVTQAPAPTSTAAGPVLRDLLDGMLQRDPAHRPSSSQIRQALSLVGGDAQPRLVPTLALPVPDDFDRTTVISQTPSSVAPPVDPVPPARPRRLAPVAAAVTAVAVLAGAGALLARGTAGDPSAGPASSSPAPRLTPSARGGTTSPPAPSPTQTSAATVDGLEQVTGDGYALMVPAGWTRSDSDAGARWSDPAGGRYVLVATRDPAGPSAVGAWEDQERSFRARHSGYERLRLDGDDEQAVWEFRYDDGGARLHALDRAVVTDGVGYALYVQSRDAEWDDSQPLFDAVRDSFRTGV